MSRPYDRSEYRRNRKKAIERDGERCRICGRHWTQLPQGKRDLTAQHVVPHAIGGTDDVSNLATLCRSCHGKQDGGRRYR